jgi:hypothetical protein
MPTGTTRIRLRPANTSRVPFWGQLAIGFFWVVYVLFMMWGDPNAHDYHFLHWVFLVFSLVYIGYVLVNNAPIFGTQSYLEFTPGYIVHKNGLFRPKQVFAAENIAALELKPMVLRVRQKDGEIYAGICRQAQRAPAGKQPDGHRLVEQLTNYDFGTRRGVEQSVAVVEVLVLRGSRIHGHGAQLRHHQPVRLHPGRKIPPGLFQQFRNHLRRRKDFNGRARHRRHRNLLNRQIKRRTQENADVRHGFLGIQRQAEFGQNQVVGTQTGTELQYQIALNKRVFQAGHGLSAFELVVGNVRGKGFHKARALPNVTPPGRK